MLPKANVDGWCSTRYFRQTSGFGNALRLPAQRTQSFTSTHSAVTAQEQYRTQIFSSWQFNAYYCTTLTIFSLGFYSLALGNVHDAPWCQQLDKGLGCHAMTHAAINTYSFADITDSRVADLLTRVKLLHDTATRSCTRSSIQWGRKRWL